jgi:outer membrane protein assembly factor BamD (BamD/ComL family)
MKPIVRRALVFSVATVGVVAMYRLRPPSQRNATTPSAADKRPDEEATLVAGAQAALGQGNTEHAFSLLYEAATKFPHGKLVSERELLHITTLCRAGKAEDARQETSEFLTRHPDSPLADQVRAACPARP